MRSSIDTNGGTPTVVEPVTVLPEQFFQAPSTTLYSRGEFALMRAVLEGALVCFEKQFAHHNRRSLELAREAEEWIQNSDSGWPFSFVNVCATLGLDAGCVRRQLTLRQGGNTLVPPASPTSEGDTGTFVLGGIMVPKRQNKLPTAKDNRGGDELCLIPHESETPREEKNNALSGSERRQRNQTATAPPSFSGVGHLTRVGAERVGLLL
jgi:hypothetical protein